MSEEVLWVILGLLVAFNVGHFATLRKCEAALMALTVESQRLTAWDPSSIMEDLNGEVAQMVADVMASMRTPTIADHLGGVISQFAQMRMMKMLQSESTIAQAAEAVFAPDVEDEPETV